nr:hypothetical protein [Tanacetum cinerariifolium]
MGRSILNPTYKYKLADKDVPVTEGSSETTTERYTENYKNVSQDIRDQLNVEAEAVQIIFTRIDNDIYSIVDASQEIWEAIERLKQGESLNIKDVKTNLLWEFVCHRVCDKRHSLALDSALQVSQTFSILVVVEVRAKHSLDDGVRLSQICVVIGADGYAYPVLGDLGVLASPSPSKGSDSMSVPTKTACMVVRVPPAMLLSLYISIAEMSAMSDSAFRKRRGGDKEVEESSDSDTESEDAEDEGPTTDDEDPAIGDEGLTAGDEGLSMGGESLGLGGDEAVLEGQQRAVSIMEPTVSKPLGLGYEALRRREIALGQGRTANVFKVGQSSGFVPESERQERVLALRQPTLTIWIDPEDESSTQADEAQISRVPVPLREDPYEAVRQDYLNRTDTEFKPFEEPELPLTIAPSIPLSESTPPVLVLVFRRTARMAVCVLSAMSPGFSASIAEVAAMSDSVFRKRFRSSYESSPSVSPPDLPFGCEDAEDEGPTAEDKDPTAGDESLAAGVEGQEEEEAVPGGSATGSSGCGDSCNRAFRTWGPGSTLESERPEGVSAFRQPTLTTWMDPEDSIVYIGIPTYPPPAPPVQTPPSPESLEREQERTVVTFGALWRPVLALEAWVRRVDTRMVDMSRAGYDDHRLVYDMLVDQAALQRELQEMRDRVTDLEHERDRRER